MKTNDSADKFVLVDANSLLHRAYHALPPLMDKKGRPTGAVYGVASMIVKILVEIEPQYIAVAWDVRKKNFRHEIYSGYKAKRKEMADDLREQIEYTWNLFDSFGIPQLSYEGFEADDVIGTFAQKLSNQKKDIEILIVTGDMDLLQLVDEDVFVYTMRRGFSDVVLYNKEKVKERFDGLSVEQIVDYKALKGDSSDNIPGIRGVGDKTATQLLNKYTDIDGIYENISEITGRKQKLLIEGEEDARMSYDLATIKRDVPLDIELNNLETYEVDYKDIESGLIENNFSSLVKRFANNGLVNVDEVSEKDVDTKDYEQVDLAEFDIYIAAHLIYDKTGKELALENLALQHLDLKVPKDNITNKVSSYIESKLAEKYKKELAKPENKQIEEIFYKIEMPLKSVLKAMEDQGVLVDHMLLHNMIKDLTQKLAEVESNVYEEIGYEINLNSPKQIEELLFEELGLPVIKKTKTQRSTSEEVLQKLKGLHPVIAHILNYRELNKIISTYLKPLPEYLDEDSRVHTTFNQTNVSSGRLSSENPNLQNIPTGKEYALRRLFIAPTDYKLVAFDYSQFELRIMAHITKDGNLLKAFQEDIDIHAMTAGEIFDKGSHQVTSDERNTGKTINFALMYGMGTHSLAKSLGVDRSEAENYLEKFTKKFPAVEEWKKHQLEQVREKGYVETLYGRRRKLPGIRSKNFHQRSSAERIAINHPLQGTQADLMKMAMLDLADWITQENLEEEVKMVLQVHDELVFEVAENSYKQISKDIQNIMEYVVTLQVPLVVNAKVGKNWFDMDDINK